MNSSNRNIKNNYFFSNHAISRSLERNIDIETTMFVMRHGEAFETSLGRIAYWFNKRAAAKCAVSWSSKRNVYNIAVIASPEGEVITVMPCYIKNPDWNPLTNSYIR